MMAHRHLSLTPAPFRLTISIRSGGIVATAAATRQAL